MKYIFRFSQLVFLVGFVEAFRMALSVIGWKQDIFRLAYSYLFINNIKGDYLEFGVYRGASFVASFKSLRVVSTFYNTLLKAHMVNWKVRNFETVRFFAFDSFAGMPESSEQGIAEEHMRGQLACTQDSFISELRRNNVNFDRIIIEPGFFSVTLTNEFKKKHQLKHAAFVYVDCDICESALDALEFVSDLLVDGAVLAFDDWNHFRGRDDRGERAALKKWLERHPDISVTPFHAFGPLGYSFLVHRNV